MTWVRKREKWNWRHFLTQEEETFMREADADAAKIAEQQAAWSRKYQPDRMKIVNRAIQRAKYYEANPK